MYVADMSRERKVNVNHISDELVDIRRLCEQVQSGLETIGEIPVLYL